MTEAEYLIRIADLWPAPGQSSTKDLLALAEEAVRAFPDSADLWWNLGLALLRHDHEDPALTQRCLECLRRTVELDPHHADAYEEMGYLLDTYYDDFSGAEDAFRKAILLGAGVDSYIGLARVLAELGHCENAIQTLSRPQCPYADEPSVQEIKEEIVQGLWSPSP